ncbi:exported hypothetical protein [Cupriavidus taiwanensis]|nr:exported hypothetical protein [Cupriavidus taiwanensis]
MRTKRNLPHTESRPLPYGRHHACRAIGLAVSVLACSAVLVDTDNGRDACSGYARQTDDPTAESGQEPTSKCIAFSTSQRPLC